MLPVSFVHGDGSAVSNAALLNLKDHWSFVLLCFFLSRNFISRSRAVTTNWPVLSPCSFNASTASATSCGTRTSNRFDFALMPLVAMIFPLLGRCPTSYIKISTEKSIDVSDTLVLHCVRHLILIQVKMRNPAVLLTLTGSLTTT